MIDYKECWDKLALEIKDLEKFAQKLKKDDLANMCDSLLILMRKYETESQIESQRREMAKGCPF